MSKKQILMRDLEAQINLTRRVDLIHFARCVVYAGWVAPYDGGAIKVAEHNPLGRKFITAVQATVEDTFLKPIREARNAANKE